MLLQGIFVEKSTLQPKDHFNTSESAYFLKYC